MEPNSEDSVYDRVIGRATDGDGVTVVNRRVDSSLSPALVALARQGHESFGHGVGLSIESHLAELLRLRVSQINNCTYCLSLHYDVARDLGVSRVRIDTLSAWWETNLYSPAERAALAYAEALTRTPDSTSVAPFQQAHDAMAQWYSKEQVLDIAGLVINMNIWTRLKLAEGSSPSGRPTL